MLQFFSKTQEELSVKVFRKYYDYKKSIIELKLRFDNPPNTFNPRLRINYFGNNIVNKSSEVGTWCDIDQGVNIRSNNSQYGRIPNPKIGSNIWTGPGMKVFGEIKEGSRVVIEARSEEEAKTVEGIPSTATKESGAEFINKAASTVRMEVFFVQHPQLEKYKGIVSG